MDTVLDVIGHWLQRFTDPWDYAFWYLVLGVLLLGLERLRPWRPAQALRRPQWQQDMAWVLLNGFVTGTMVVLLAQSLWALLRVPDPDFPVLASWPWWLQFLVVLVVKDFIEWWVHRALHTIPWLWQFHKLHHSIKDMDWMGNMRFHPMEIVIYKAALWLPLAFVVIDWRVALSLAVFQTFIGHLNHANIRWDWGPLFYIFNSPRFHLWHHDRAPENPTGCNYAIIFSCWDWLFGTAHYPADADTPEQGLGFDDDANYPKTAWRRLCYPFYKSGH